MFIRRQLSPKERALLVLKPENQRVEPQAFPGPRAASHRPACPPGPLALSRNAPSSRPFVREASPTLWLAHQVNSN